MGNAERDIEAEDKPSDEHADSREEPTIASDPPAPSTSAISGAAAPTVGPNAPSVPNSDSSPSVPPAELLPSLPPELANHPRYCPLELLGQGGMGSVFKASHRVMEREVALKVIRPELARPDIVERFRREIRAAARLSHPNIVTAHDAEQAGNVHFLVVEYVDGQSLDRLVAREGALDVQRACVIVRKVAEGLQHAYEVGMVHRDIKPQNIMCTATGQTKILDFGLALVYSDASNTSALTQGGGVMGTPDYIAPEQADNAHAADTRSDIYSLGCTLYFLLRGKPPFSEGSIVQKLMAHVDKQPPSLNEFRKDIPAGLLRVLDKSMAKRPENRYQTPLEFEQALGPYCDGRELDEEIVIPTLVAPVAGVSESSKPPVRSPSVAGSLDGGSSLGSDSSQGSFGGSVAQSGSGSANDPLASEASRAQPARAASTVSQQHMRTEVFPTAQPVSAGIHYVSDSGVEGSIESLERAATAATIELEETQRNWPGKVALYLGFFSLLFAWIPCVGYGMLLFSGIGLCLAIFSIVMSWGVPDARMRYQVAAAIICAVSIAVSALSGFMLNWLG